MNLKEILSKIFLFDSFNDHELQLLSACSTVKNIFKDEHIFHEGQSATAFFIIISGRVKIYRISPSGDEHILHIYSKNDILAEAAIFDLRTYPAYCLALEETELIRISRDRFIDLLRHNPDLSLRMMSSYSKKLRSFLNKISDLSFLSIKSRLAKYLVDNCIYADNISFCYMSLSKKELASLIGTIPETFSRSLDYLKKKNWVEEKDRKIILLDIEKLKLLAEL